MSNAPIRVHVKHTYTSDPKTVFDALSEHENLGPVFGAKITRKTDGDANRNGVGSSRQLNIGPLPPITETVVVWEPNTHIEYEITKGGFPLKNHYGVQRLTPTADGGTELDYTIAFDSVIPGMAPVVAKQLTAALSKGLPRLVP
ncbi:MAG TPA: SRPBCC family protein [Aeromicrobium sp.]|nr:SRPBCC family protein [Aeromicrobium sp.]